MLTRTVADTAAFLDVLAGYEPGDATWAPPPAEPFARDGRGGAAGRPADRGHEAPPVADAAVDPALRGAPSDDAAEQLRSLGPRGRRVSTRRGAAIDVGDVFGVVFASHVALLIAYSGRVAGPRARGARTWSR